MQAVTAIKQAIITIMEKLVLESLSLLHRSPNAPTPSETTLAGANLPDGNSWLSLARGKQTPGRLTAPEAGAAQTQHLQKGSHSERPGATARYQSLFFFFNDYFVGLLHREKCYVRRKKELEFPVQ